TLCQTWRHHPALGALASRTCRRHARLAGGDARHAMGGDEAMIVAGIGFRRSVAADEIVALVELALDRASLARDALGRLATIAALAETPAFTEAARRLNVTAMPVTESALAAAAPH